VNPPPLQLIAASEILPSPGWRTPPLMHDHYELIVIKSGQMLLKTIHGDLLATRGDILCYQPGLVHEEISQDDDPVHSLFLAFKAKEALPAFPLRMHDTEGRLLALLSWLVRDCRRGRPAEGRTLLLAAIVSELGWLLAQSGDPWREEIRAWMLENLAKPITLADLARKCAMSCSAFVRKFRQAAGRTPMAELRLMRLNEARNRILSSGLPLKTIAPATGIGDEFQLSKLFRRYFGASPSEIRKSPKSEPPGGTGSAKSARQRR